jgi:hypothetical protein
LNSSDIRLQKIIDLIADCRYSIHDLSRTELDRSSALPRFNMPLELGMDLGCRAFSSGHGDKSFLIFDRDRFRFQTYISDIAGQDIADHGNDPNTAIAHVRDWIRTETKRANIPGSKAMQSKYARFRMELPAICERFELDISTLTFADFLFAVAYSLAPAVTPPTGY